MVNLIRYSYFGLVALTLLTFFIGCGDDEEDKVDDVGPAVVATPEGVVKGTIVDVVTGQGIAGVQVILVAPKKLSGGDFAEDLIGSITTMLVGTSYLRR